MMRKGWFVLAAAAAGVVLAYGLVTTRAQSGSSAPTAIGVVDIVKIFNEYDQTKWLNQQFEQRKQAVKAEADARSTDIKSTRDSLEILHPDTPEYQRTSWELIRKQGELDGFLSAAEFQVGQEHKDWTLKTYQEIESTVARAAEQYGLEIVLTYEQLQTDVQDSAALRQQIRLRHLIYRQPRIDLTDRVLSELNAAFAKKSPPKLPQTGSGLP